MSNDPSKRFSFLICVLLLLHSTKCSSDPYQTSFDSNYDDYEQQDAYQTHFYEENHNEIDDGNWLFYPNLDRQGQQAGAAAGAAANAASQAANEVEEAGKGRNKEPVTGNFLAALTRLFNPQLAQAFLINQFIAVSFN